MDISAMYNFFFLFLVKSVMFNFVRAVTGLDRDGDYSSSVGKIDLIYWTYLMFALA